MRKTEIPESVRYGAYAVSAFISSLWVYHTLTNFWHSLPFLIQSYTWPWYVFPALIILMAYLALWAQYSTFISSIGFGLSCVVGIPLTIYVCYAVLRSISWWVHPPTQSGGIEAVAYALSFSLNPVKFLTSFAVLLTALGSILAQRPYKRWQLLLLIIFWTAAVIQLLYMAWSCYETKPMLHFYNQMQKFHGST